MTDREIKLMLKSLGELIHRLRKDKGYTQEALGKITSTSQMTIKRLESATVGTRIDNLFAVAKALGVSLSDMFSTIEGKSGDKLLSDDKWDRIKELVESKSAIERKWIADLIAEIFNSPWLNEK